MKIIERKIMDENKLVEEINKRFEEVWNANSKMRNAIQILIDELLKNGKITNEEADRIALNTGIMVAPTRSEPIRLK